MRCIIAPSGTPATSESAHHTRLGHANDRRVITSVSLGQIDVQPKVSENVVVDLALVDAGRRTELVDAAGGPLPIEVGQEPIQRGGVPRRFLVRPRDEPLGHEVRNDRLERHLVLWRTRVVPVVRMILELIEVVFEGSDRRVAVRVEELVDDLVGGREWVGARFVQIRVADEKRLDEFRVDVILLD